jgi:hypothetical protein
MLVQVKPIAVNYANVWSLLEHPNGMFNGVRL